MSDIRSTINQAENVPEAEAKNSDNDEMSNIRSVTDQAKSNPEATKNSDDDDNNLNIKGTGDVKNDKMSGIKSVTNQAKSNPKAEEQNNQDINPKDMGDVKEDKEQKLRSKLRVKRIQQEKDDFGYYKQNAKYINEAYKTIMDFIFNNTCRPPRWVILLMVLAFTYIFGNIDKELIDNNCLLIIQSILRTSYEALVAFFIILLAVPSAKGIRRLFSRFTDKML